MVNVVPFRGVLYNPQKIDDLSDVVAPPFDVISKAEQDYFYQRHPHNIIRLILGKLTPDDSSTDNPHTRSADFYHQWLDAGVLKQDNDPAFYLTSVEFMSEEQMITRYGLIALVKLESFDKGVILPHEKTFSKVRSERLDLMKACHANFSPIFSLYSDQNGILEALTDAALAHKPDMNVINHKGLRHKLWRITKPSVLRYVSEAIKERTLFIADGHHRYETALNYREWVKADTPDFTDKHPANFVMMYLCSIEDPGMRILPAHRMFRNVAPLARANLIRKAQEYFEIITFPIHPENRAGIRDKFAATVKKNGVSNTIGVYMKNCAEYYVFILKADVMDKMFRHELADSVRNIDVTVLTRLILMKLLGFDQAMLDDENLIRYSTEATECIDAIDAGQCDITFILNPTKIEQVQQVAGARLVMPRKATYFYPKVLSGRVLNTLVP
jgi:uncharacterized protein (DUF1015 family)